MFPQKINMGEKFKTSIHLSTGDLGTLAWMAGDHPRIKLTNDMTEALFLSKGKKRILTGEPSQYTLGIHTISERTGEVLLDYVVFGHCEEVKTLTFSSVLLSQWWSQDLDFSELNEFVEIRGKKYQIRVRSNQGRVFVSVEACQDGMTVDEAKKVCFDFIRLFSEPYREYRRPFCLYHAARFWIA